MRSLRFWSAYLVWAVIALCLAGLLAGCGGSSSGGGDEILASGDGVSITGDPKAVPPGTTLTAAGLSEEQAEAEAPFPKDAVFSAGADCGPDGTTFAWPVKLNFTIPEKSRPGWHLAFYHLENGAWMNSGREATVGHDGVTATTEIAHLSDYVLFLDDNWATTEYAGHTLAYRLTDIPATEIENPRVLVQGKTEDQAVIDKVREITGYSEDEAKYLLRSWDTSGDRLVQILELREPCYATRYASLNPADKLGRWYSTSDTDNIYLPDKARSWYALPNVNTALNYTLYRFKKGAVVILGTCADMTWSPVFGPYATGGGEQFYAPNATKWVVDHPELNPEVIELAAELRFVRSVDSAP
ncbi:MAG: hypothetical protein NTU88_13580 [Armatimonadetes bacterium]|nr:hypothetical protein [Armatimonadota bacterium]